MSAKLNVCRLYNSWISANQGRIRQSSEGEAEIIRDACFMSSTRRQKQGNQETVKQG